MRYVLLLLLAACHSPTSAGLPPFAVITQQGILLVDGEARTAVPDTADISSFCWSADGKRLFGAVGGALWEIALNGERKPCVGGFHALRFPDAAPSGDRIAFAGQAKEGDGWTLWIVSLPGGRPRDVGPGYSPTWSPDSRHIHYERMATPGGIGELEVASGRHRIAPATGAGAYTPVRSPRTGNFLLFSRRELWLHDFRSGSARRLTELSDYQRFGSFSPDETLVLYFANEQRGIRLHDLQSGEDRRLDLPSAELARFRPR